MSSTPLTIEESHDHILRSLIYVKCFLTDTNFADFRVFQISKNPCKGFLLAFFSCSV